MAYQLSTGGGLGGTGITLDQLRAGIYGGNYPSSGGSTAPASQQNFPTSAYGQTIPVIWGIARVPGAYIWAPDIIVRTTTDTDGAFIVTVTTTVTVSLSARIRFARPLVADSRWRLRRLWADGALILDASTGYRKPGLSVRFYDGYSTQGRDPTMVAQEGANNVSAHRGYLDIVITNYNLGAAGVPPPAFEAELVQDATSGVDIDITTGFFSDAVDSYAATDWDNGRWFGITDDTTTHFLRVFDIGANQETYSAPISGLLHLNSDIDERSPRYIPEIDRLICVDVSPLPIDGGPFPCLIDPATGAIIGHGLRMGAAGQVVNALTTVVFGNSAGVMIGSTSHLGYLSTYRFTDDEIVQVSLSGSGWDSRGMVECFAVGTVAASEADIYAVAGDTLYKIRINSTGGILGVADVYTDADDLVYCVFHDGGIVAWNDNAEVIRVNVTTGAVEWTETVPYTSFASLASPDLHRLDDVLMVESVGDYYFTDLTDGTTTTVAKSDAAVGSQVYDGIGNLAINTDRSVEIARIQRFDVVGDGELRDLEDFLVDLMVAGGFDASEIEVENVDDQILGAVIDITSGVRDVARSVCEPYSIAIFERAGQIIFKRASTDGAFAIDATIGSTDVIDQGGQAISATRLNPQEIPSKYGINYRDHEEVYQARPQWGSIPTLPLPVATTDMGIRADIPIISDGDTIKALATKRVYRLAVQKHEFNMGLRAEHLKIEPESIGQFTFAGRLITARVVEQTINPNFTNTISATEFLSSVAVSISGASGRPVEPEPVGTALSRYIHLDIPLITDTDDLSGAGLRQYHVLTSDGQPFWDGAALYRKDASGTYIGQSSQVEDGLVLIALEELPDVDIPYVTEFTRTLTVARRTGDTDLLASVTYEEMLSGANMFAIGQPGRWEVCHVQTITSNGDNTYTFETLRRGRGTSEEFTGVHEAGDLVVWLSGDNVQSLEYTIASLNDAFDFKPVGFGGSLATTIAVNRIVTGEAEKIPKPALLEAAIDGADIDLAWVRRTRIGSYWSDEGEDAYLAPLGESLEQYVIRIKDGPAGSILRTVTVDDVTAYTYSAANITTDFGSMPDELTYDIRQVSGTGVICPTREATITL